MPAITPKALRDSVTLVGWVAITVPTGVTEGDPDAEVAVTAAALGELVPPVDGMTAEGEVGEGIAEL